jgi:pimeloyl-ACP methyl ester carboxylesterase
VILINTGSNHHVGPNRLHVNLARRLAGEGFHVLRMDISGVGDSLVRPGGRENHMYSACAPEDVQAAMDALSARTRASRFVLVGICSGAYVAFHTSLADRRVAEQILVNLQTFDFRDGDSLVLRKRLFGRSTRAYRRLLFHPRTWWRFLKGSLDVHWVVRVLLHRARERAGQHASALRSLITYGRYEHSDVARRFKDLDDRGVATLLVYADDDGGLDTIEQHLGPDARAMRSRSRFGMRTVSGADHTFTPTSSQPRLLDLVSSELARRFPPASPVR